MRTTMDHLGRCPSSTPIFHLVTVFKSTDIQIRYNYFIDTPHNAKRKGCNSYFRNFTKKKKKIFHRTFFVSEFTTTTNNSPQHQAARGQHIHARSSSIPIYSLHPPRKFPFPLNISFMVSSHSRRGRPAFHLTLDDWSKRTIFGNLTSFIRRTCPSHLNLSFITALEIGIEPHFSYILLFEIRSVSRVPRTIYRRVSKKHLENLHPFRSTHASEPYLTTVITVP